MERKKNIIKTIIKSPIDKVFEFTVNPKNTHLWVNFIKKEISQKYPPEIGDIYESYRDENNLNKMKVFDFKKNEIFVLSDLDENLFVSYKYKVLDKNETEIIYSDWKKNEDFKSPITKEIFNHLKIILENN